MKAFVTGGTGLLGNNLVRLLVAQGHEVKALARSREKAERLLGDTEVEIVSGDMQNVEAFAGEMAGCDVLFHTAAYFREYYQPGDHWGILNAVNVQGTIRLLEAAEQQGVGKAIHTSSAGVIAKSSNGQPSDEMAPYNPFAETNLYFKSKVLAEKAIFEFLKTHSLPVVLILPGWMLGPGDAAPTSSGQLVLDFLARKLPGIPDGGTDVADPRDVAQVMIQAVERGQSGERYIAAGRFATLEDIFVTLEAVTGIPAPRRHLPYAASLAYAWVVENVARLTRRKAMVTVNGIRTMHEKIVLSSDRAIRELDASFRPLQETLRDEVAWFQAHGYVETASA